MAHTFDSRHAVGYQESRCATIAEFVQARFALALKGVISALLFAYTVYTGGVIVAILAGFYRDKLKVTPLGAMISIIGGGAAAVISKVMSIQYLDIGSLLIAAILLFSVSFLDRKLRQR